MHREDLVGVRWCQHVSSSWVSLRDLFASEILRDLERYAGMSVDAIAVEVNQQVLQVESSALLKLQSCSILQSQALAVYSSNFGPGPKF